MLDAVSLPGGGAVGSGGRHRVRYGSRPLALALALAFVAAACAGNGATPPAPASANPGSPSGSTAPETGTVRLALDWTPNTNHTGFFVARQRGWYEQQGVELDVLPYTGTTPEALIAAGQAECGISFHDALTFAVAAGVPAVSVMAILQHTGQEIAVLASSDIERPRDLDGRTYAGFGYPNEVPTLQAVIEADGGTGEFDVVTLDTAAYEALYAGRADFAIIFTAQEGVEARLRDIELRAFAFTDYGFPDFYQVVLACDRDFLERDPDLARRFVEATARGFAFAAAEPDEAAAILVEENPGVFDANPELPAESQRFLADGGYLVDEGGRVGHQTLERWRGYSSFLYEQGLLVDAAGQPLAEPPDYASLFTNDFLP